MKNLFSLKAIVVALFTLIGALGCSSDVDSAINDVKVNTVEMDFTIGMGETLTYTLGGGWPTDGGLDISLQPKHFLVSRLFLSPDGAGVQYEYIPTADFTGKDYLEITLRSSIGDNDFFAKTVFKITIEVIVE